MPETKATLRYLHASAYKVREVLGLIRGLDVAEARHVLQFCDRGSARDVLKVLNSAVANAEHTMDLPADELFVSIAYADEGPTIKRWRPRARGRATRIRKRTSHITIVVARLSDEQLQIRRRKEASATGGGRRRGVLPGRRRRTEEKPAPARAKGKAVAAPEPAEAEPAVEEPTPVSAAPPVAELEESAEERAARYASLGRESDAESAAEAAADEPASAEDATPEASEEGEQK